jgi:hypothetical protein
MWVTGYEGIVKETADQLARTRSEHRFTGPKPACGISVVPAKKAVRDWMKRNLKKHWESINGLRKAKGLILGPSARRWVVELFTGHCHLEEHLFKLGLRDDPTCKRCLEKDESATHILSDCKAIAYLRFHYLSQSFMEPSDYYDAPINKVLHFIQSAGLIKG